jgi:hypothetical protein
MPGDGRDGKSVVGAAMEKMRSIYGGAVLNGRESMKRYLVYLLVGAAWSANAYQGPRPQYLEAEVTWKDAAGAERTVAGQLWFADLPVKGAKGLSFGKPGHYDGIKWFVPQKPGDIWLARGAGNTNGQAFLLHDYCGEREIELAFDGIDVLRTAESKLNKLMEDGVRSMTTTKPAAGSPPGSKDVDLGDLEPDAPMVAGVASTTTTGQAGSPLRFATPQDIGTKEIKVADVVKIVFGPASDGIKRERYGGRYLEYSRAAKGDNGRVQVAAATFFGGPEGQESFVFGGFQRDNGVVTVGNFHDLGFVNASLVQVIGTDPAADAYPPVDREVKGRPVREFPRQTPVVVHYSADLKQLTGLVRLPWGVGAAATCALGGDDALFMAGFTGPHFETFAKETKLTASIPAPPIVADAKGRKREPGPDSFVIKLTPDHQSVLWLVRVQGGGVNIFPQPAGNVLARRGDELFYIAADGSVSAGPKLEITGSNMAVCPKTGAIYFGGSYRSGTGLEPYVNPYLYKLDATGKHVWTAYGWTGPIVGVDQHRLVADSAVTKVRVAEDGRLTLTAWSDGGNTVLGCQPYDLRQDAKCGGFCSSTWGATGGLTVRIAHLINMDPDTMEVSSFTRYVGYIPTSDIPTLINIYDSWRLPSGEVAVTGGGWTGFVESQDAWIKSWWAEHRTDAHALAKGGPFFTLFTPDFNRVRLATLTPGASGLRLAGKGQWVLLYGGATDLPPTAVDRKWNRQFRTITRNAVQPQNGGGLDAYVLLVDTQGEPVKGGE